MLPQIQRSIQGHSHLGYPRSAGRRITNYVTDHMISMSLQINLSNSLKIAYLDVLTKQGIDWAIFTSEKGTNDPKVQATGNGGLEELEEEFSNGR